jgi:DNA-directed RNA polymerase specialized sigma24 family protein
MTELDPWVVVAEDAVLEPDEPPRLGVHGALRQSFTDLYQSEFVSMVRLAVALTGSEATAEDLVHDAFIRVHKHWARVEHPRAYLRTAVVNACRSSGRRAARERTAHARRSVDVVPLGADEVFDALATLPYRQKAAIVLQFYEGLTQAEIADVLGCREGTVASLVHRGLAQLRKVIEP